MGPGRRVARVLLAVLITLSLLLWAVGLMLFSQVAEPTDDFAKYLGPILAINIAGLSVLLALIVRRLVRLVRDYRRFVPGSRLEARVVGLVVAVAAAPLVVLYLFSVVFITKGMDDWFPVDFDQALEAAFELMDGALEPDKQASLARLRQLAEGLGGAEPAGLQSRLAGTWAGAGAAEIALYSAEGSRLSVHPGGRDSSAPDVIDAVLLGQLTAAEAEAKTGVVKLEVLPEVSELHAALRLAQAGGSPILWGRFPLPPEIAAPLQQVFERQQDLGEFEATKSILGWIFVVVQSVVLLVAILAAVYAAFFVAQRLISPIQQLMQGTRAVARGDFDTKVPLAQRDEIGFLVNSFNNMTQRLALARQEARDSERRLEGERSKLEVILARLSTGVVSLESDLSIRTANKAAGHILGVELEQHVGESLVELAATKPLLKEFFGICARHLEAGRTEWREQITLRGDRGNRELICACTGLPTEGGDGQGYVIVFDDITVLMQAQREAAWGEVARRLAHEIKNPLTPIQLSAERVRRRYLTDGSDDLDLLDRATHTIIQQVDAMKGMVDAFSEYARVPDIELAPLDVNAVISEVTELYRHQVPPVTIRMDLDRTLPMVEADIGRLRQVMHNLMRNASEAVEGLEDAEIAIATRQRDLADGAYAEIVVSDNGPGFAADIIDQAFLPYVTSKDKGTGLGLAIVRKLVEEHGGQIHAGNKTRRGAEVSILLPLPGAERSAGAVRRARHRRKRA